MLPAEEGADTLFGLFRDEQAPERRCAFDRLAPRVDFLFRIAGHRVPPREYTSRQTDDIRD